MLKQRCQELLLALRTQSAESMFALNVKLEEAKDDYEKRLKGACEGAKSGWHMDMCGYIPMDACVCVWYLFALLKCVSTRLSTNEYQTLWRWMYLLYVMYICMSTLA